MKPVMALIGALLTLHSVTPRRPSRPRNSLTIYLRASRGGLYAGGEALLDGQPLRDKQGTPAGFGFALYAR